ncbi:hypothetical protein BAUCODRAFT_149738 [Baudoinia panamericana UAMH 10762]|uniref:Uncharacterized protein n=1 Tax=Baudoinia panamericana (strain UAMH 10762) TaxID=717646 RepID=M2N745_BAUPA|nr:uncharacterized protein BAUCODRAFT_149738 [Baudoinia panamericana UAMH 10762]EMC94605.1 hypothetical protein BAUCODRAFT_149738 [Baudoinia panamericana UAMH 10762]
MFSALLPAFLLSSLTLAAPQWPGPNYQGHQQCSQAVVALAAGIHLNIQGQYSEFNGTVNLINIESASSVNQTAFYIAKGELLSDIQAGMNIRLFNQEIAPTGNAAIAGLAKYEAAQQTEQALAEDLTGVYAVDVTALDSLKSDITAGIQLNEENLKNATQDCVLTVVFPPANLSA